MYCPECNSEYREGFTTCAECQVPLVEGTPVELEELPGEEEPGLKVLLETTHPTALDPIVVRLEENKIPYILQSGTALSLLEGLMSETLPEDWKAIVLVPSEHLAFAKQLAAEPVPETTPVEEEDS